MKRTSLVVLAVASAACAARSASAQLAQPGIGTARSDTRGLVLGFNLTGSTIPDSRSFPGTGSGLGFGLTAAYGVSEHVSLFARGDAAYRVGHWDAGARYTFGSPAAALRPYVEGAYTRTGTSSQGIRSSGSGVTGGAGVQYFVKPNLALDVGLIHSRGRFDENARVPNSRFSTTRLNIGFRWHP
ncbi:MAG TPA: hypothetical protein VF541_07630 [Longimicrobium sp.]